MLAEDGGTGTRSLETLIASCERRMAFFCFAPRTSSSSFFRFSNSCDGSISIPIALSRLHLASVTAAMINCNNNKKKKDRSLSPIEIHVKRREIHEHSVHRWGTPLTLAAPLSHNLPLISGE